MNNTFEKLWYDMEWIPGYNDSFKEFEALKSIHDTAYYIDIDLASLRDHEDTLKDINLSEIIRYFLDGGYNVIELDQLLRDGIYAIYTDGDMFYCTYMADKY